MKTKNFIMKKMWLLLLIVPFLISSCNPVPNKPIYEKLTPDELAKAIKSDTSFTPFYEGIRVVAELMSDVQKATYKDLTYRRLFNYVSFLNDEAYWKPLTEEWESEWEKENSFYIPKVDSVIAYWEKYLEENSLNNYVKIELVQIKKKWYTYINRIEDVYLGFKLTPLKGRIDQVRFTYGYLPKISEKQYYSRKKCLDTDPLTAPRVDYWEVSYSDQDFFASQTVEHFLRDYNLYIEVTDIRKDGVNINKDDFDVPESISDYFDNKGIDYMEDYYKGEVIKELINRDYLNVSDYCFQKVHEMSQKKDKLCYDFVQEMSELGASLDSFFDLSD